MEEDQGDTPIKIQLIFFVKNKLIRIIKNIEKSRIQFQQNFFFTKILKETVFRGYLYVHFEDAPMLRLTFDFLINTELKFILMERLIVNNQGLIKRWKQILGTPR